jgi:hypothetical protein
MFTSTHVALKMCLVLLNCTSIIISIRPPLSCNTPQTNRHLHQPSRPNQASRIRARDLQFTNHTHPPLGLSSQLACRHARTPASCCLLPLPLDPQLLAYVLHSNNTPRRFVSPSPARAALADCAATTREGWLLDHDQSTALTINLYEREGIGRRCVAEVSLWATRGQD